MGNKMKEIVPSKTEQIEAIIHDKVYDITIEYAGRDKSGKPQYSKVFTVTKKEFEDYAKCHYRLDNLPFVHTEPREIDGLYIIPIKNGYRVYNQVRNIHIEESLLTSERDVWNTYFNYTISTVGAPILTEA